MSATPEQIADAVVEHVAQAISFNDNGNYTPNYKWSLVPELLQDSYRRNARAAITAYLTATKDAQAERVRVLESMFGHYHVGPGDKCGQCGLDLRDRVHTRAVKS